MSSIFCTVLATTAQRSAGMGAALIPGFSTARCSGPEVYRAQRNLLLRIGEG